MKKNEDPCECYAPEWSADDNVMFPGHVCEACIENVSYYVYYSIKCSYTPQNNEPLEPLAQEDDLPF